MATPELNSGPPAMADASETSRVLSFSGGGVRGYLSILMFEEYCKRLHVQEVGDYPSDEALDEFVDKTVLPSFLLIAGTSIGGIIAVLLSIGVPLSVLKATLATPSKVFSKNSWVNPTKWFSPKYNHSGLMQLYIDVLAGGDPNGLCKYQDYLKSEAKALKAVDLQLCHLKRVCAVTTYDLNSSTSLWLSNNKLPWLKKPQKYAHVRLVDAMLSTSAAPSYFPIREFEYEGDQMKCVDGGIWANDSSLVALFIARGKKVQDCKRGQDADTKYSLFSFGTGYPGKKKWSMMAQGAFGWIAPTTGEVPLLALLDSSTAAAKQFMRGFEEMGVVNYYPFDIELVKEKIELDDIHSIPAQDRVFQEAMREAVDEAEGRNLTSILARSLKEILPPSLSPLQRVLSPSQAMLNLSLISPKPTNLASSASTSSSSLSSSGSTAPKVASPSVTGKRASLQPSNNPSSTQNGEGARTTKSFTLKVPPGKRQK